MSNVIDVNDDFRASALKRFWENYGNSTDSVTVRLFDGTMPTYTELEGYANGVTHHADGWMVTSEFNANMLAGGSYTNLLSLTYTNLTNRRLTTQKQMDFFLSQRAESAFGLADGSTATWFWMFQHVDGNPDSYSYWHIFGTVGGIESGADLEMTDPVIDTTRSYKLNDITVNFNINVQAQQPAV